MMTWNTRLLWTLGLFAGLVMTDALGNSSRGWTMNGASADSLPIHSASVLCRQERMENTLYVQRNNATRRLENGDSISVTSGEIAEDKRDVDQIVLVFSAKAVNGLGGFFVLFLWIEPSSPGHQGKLTVRQPRMEQKGDRFAVHLQVEAQGLVHHQWGYTRHPKLRDVCLGLLDDDDETLAGQIMHHVAFPGGAGKTTPERGWQPLQIELDASLIKQSVPLDHCESLLGALDRAIRQDKGDFLQWPTSRVSQAIVDRAAREVEDRLRKERIPVSFHVTMEFENRETTRGKRLQPLVRHPVTLLDANGTPKPAVIGLSVTPTR